jgi:DNA-binding NarL/FixJ family response regulator
VSSFDFNKREYDHFMEYCGFTDEGKAVLDMRRRGMSVVEIGLTTYRSEATINRTIKRIKSKIKDEIKRGAL